MSTRLGQGPQWSGGGPAGARCWSGRGTRCGSTCGSRLGIRCGRTTSHGRSSGWARSGSPALRSLGVADPSVQGAAPRSRTRWSGLVCFGGLGAGEVSVAGGRKLVGLAQRRVRTGAWIQGACAIHWDPATLLGTLALPTEVRAGGGRRVGRCGGGCGGPRLGPTDRCPTGTRSPQRSSPTFPDLTAASGHRGHRSWAECAPIAHCGTDGPCAADRRRAASVPGEAGRSPAGWRDPPPWWCERGTGWVEGVDEWGVGE